MIPGRGWGAPRLSRCTGQPSVYVSDQSIALHVLGHNNIAARVGSMSKGHRLVTLNEYLF